jgi:hypothetical protein
MTPELKAFIDRVVVPALLERFLREQTLPAARVEPPNFSNNAATV